jgi:hypothetical protein
MPAEFFANGFLSDDVYLPADPFSQTSQQKPVKPVEAIGRNLQLQYEHWQPRVCGAFCLHINL